MDSLNTHVEEYFDDFCKLSVPPEFAVLIKGSWGSGKTWFIKDYLKKSKSIESIYISLYGITSIKEIETALLTTLIKKSHRIFESDKVDKGLKLFKSLFGEKMPEINVIDYLPKKEKFIFVFDDLERCSININDVLGYINNYVEHHGLKVILIADESKIKERAESLSNGFLYKDIKEKLIGETFEVEANLKEALTGFIANIESDEVCKLFSDYKVLISRVYKESAYDNLRLLKQALWGFERFYNKLDEEIITNINLTKDLLYLYLLYSFEIKSGNLSINDLMPRFAINSEDSGNNPFIIIEQKYSNLPIIAFSSPILKVEMWEVIFGKGKIDDVIINKHLKETKYFTDEKSPDWKKLWNYWNLEEKNFKRLLSKIESDFDARKFEDLGELKHVIAAFLKFSDKKLFKKTKAVITKESKEYIQYLKEERKLDSITIGDRDSWNKYAHGHEFMSSESEEFKAICKIIDENIEQSKIEKYPEVGEKLIKLMTDNTIDFMAQLIYVPGVKSSPFREIPIFKYVNPKKFVESYLLLLPEDQITVKTVFKERYSRNLFGVIFEELKFIGEIKKLFITEEESLGDTLNGYRIRNFIDHYINDAITNLEKNKKGQQSMGADSID